MQHLAVVLLIVITSAPLAAQDTQPYAGQQHRPLKALSDAEVRGYLQGEGMGYALVAELNHYPGPRHVLDLADALDLTPEQRRGTEALFENMRAEAVRLGERVVAKEAELERLFAEEAITEARLDEVLLEIGKLQARLRGVHLRTHLAMRELLSADQIARYDDLRGYTDEHAAPGHHPSGHHPAGHHPSGPHRP